MCGVWHVCVGLGLGTVGIVHMWLEDVCMWSGTHVVRAEVWAVAGFRGSEVQCVDPAGCKTGIFWGPW